jgi:c-di-GMP-binding flagellar brake protein YcgR
VLVSVEVAHEDTVAIATLVNLSHGGAFLELPDGEPLAIGVRVRVHLATGAHDLSQDAKVVRITSGEHAGFAVAWIEPSAAIAAAVDHLTAA